MIKLTSFIITILFVISSFSMNSYSAEDSIIKEFGKVDDMSVTIELLSLRALNQIDESSNPDFYLKIYINNNEFISEIWHNTKYIYDPDFSPTINIPYDEEYVDIKIQLWDYADEESIDRLCDISGDSGDSDDSYDVEITYNIKTGHWTGDDFRNEDLSNYDPSGYGRLNGCDDGTIYETDRDCELWFDIYQNDIDGDRIPEWMERYVYGTNPDVNNLGEDIDQDGIPIEWEYKWGYDPLTADNHENLDFDNDSITNIEEFITSNHGSDPFRKDLFLELDFMDYGPNDEVSIIPEGSKELMKNPFHKRNVVFHIDTGENYGGDIIKFDDKSDLEELKEYYNMYFIKNEQNEWKRGVFHYGVIVYKSFPAGFAFSSDVPPFWGYHPGTNCFTVSSSLMTSLKQKFDLYNPKNLDYLFASAIVHEMGHNFGIKSGNPKGCDVQLSKYPWQIGWWIYWNYKSIMNYHYTYEILDYSDGSHGNRDYNDWGNIDFGYFEFQ